MRLYVHTPFCLHKCHYCDFNSHVFSQPPWPDYTRALVQEIAYYALQPQFQGRTVVSIFFGGGTPSLAPASLFEAVIKAVRLHFNLSEDAEISIEANPGATDAERFKAYRYAGINRISIGVQSFANRELKWLERIHSSGEAIRAFHTARDAGFDNLNLDLMYALPDQTLDEWFASLEQAIALQPEHLSCYQLTVEPHTQLHVINQKKELALPDEDLALDFFWQTRERLQQAGYEAYEISNFALKGMHCQHNCGYWMYDDYIGIGAGAAGKWDLADGGVLRYSNLRAPQAYMANALEHGMAVHSDETLSRAEAMGEAVWLALRRKEGLDSSWFEMRFGTSLEQAYALLLKQWLAQQKLEYHGLFIRLTGEGLSLADEIAASFLV